MVKVLDAIRKINPNAEVSIGGNSVDSIQWLNGTPEISKADIEAKMAELPAIEEQETTQTETDKSSGKQKLKDLGLTDAEIKAPTGA